MNKIKNKKIYIINTAVILGMFFLILILNKISPFGGFEIGKYDAIPQFKPMLYNFITKLKAGTLLNYSFNNGLGNPQIFDFIYYYSSPLNLVALPFKSVDAMYLATMIIKLILGSIFMTNYVKDKTNNNYIIFIATISYIFSSWFVAYYYYLPWLDVFILFPLYQKGLENLLNKKNNKIYIIALALITFANFYLAFTIYIYTIIYFIINELFYKKQNFKAKIYSFNYITLSTLFSFLLLFAYFYILLDIYTKMAVPFDKFTYNYSVSIIDFIKSLLIGNINVINEMNGKTFPNIAANYFILLNTIYFFINKKINKKDKITALIAILIIIATIFIKPIDFILNMFHQIRGLTFRYSYIIIFLNIKLFIMNTKTLEYKDYKKLLYLTPLILLLILITFKTTEQNIIVFSILSLIMYVILFLLYADNKYHRLLICLVILIQIFHTGYIGIPFNRPKENIDFSYYNKENVKYRTNISEGYDNEPINGNLYHNTKVTHLMSSMTYNRSIILASKMGCETFSTAVMTCDNRNEYFNLLMNVKNNYYLEKIYAVNKSITLLDLGLDIDTKMNIENTIESMTGIKDIYEKKTLKAKYHTGKKYIFDAKEDYFLLEVYDENGMAGTIPQFSQLFIREKSNKATIYTIKKDKLEEVYSYLRKNQIKYTYYNDNKIEGTINVDKDQIIFTSIPYDASWEIKIDGKKIDQPLIVLDALIGIDVPAGTHTLSMEYKQKNYIAPAIISLISIITFIIYCIKRKNNNYITE